MKRMLNSLGKPGALLVLAALLGVGGCSVLPAHQGNEESAAQPTVAVDASNLRTSVVLQDPRQAQAAVSQARQTLQQLFEKHYWRAELSKVWSALTPFEQRLLQKMERTPDQIESPRLAVYVSGRVPSEAGETLIVEGDRVALVEALQKRADELDAILMRDYRRVPDHVTHMKQLRTLVPALPLLMERKVVEQLLWRWAPQHESSRGWRLSEKLFSHLHELFKRFTASIQADVDKSAVFEQGLHAILPRYGILTQGGVPDLLIYYDAIESSRQTGEAWKVAFSGAFRLLDDREDLLDEFSYEAESAGLDKALVRRKAVEDAVQQMLEHLDRWVLQEYDFFNKRLKKDLPS